MIVLHIILIVVAVLVLNWQFTRFCDKIQRSVNTLAPRDTRCAGLMYGIDHEPTPRTVYPEPTPEQLAYSQHWKDIGRKIREQY